MAFSLRAVASTGAANVAILGLSLVNAAVQARLLGAEGRGLLLSAMVYPTLVVGVGAGLTEPVLVRMAGDKEVKLAELKGLTVVLGWLMMVALGATTVGVLYLLDGLGMHEAKPYEYAFAATWAPLSVGARHVLSVDWGRGNWNAYNLLRSLLYPATTVGLGLLWWFDYRDVASVLSVHVGAHVLLALAVVPRLFAAPRVRLSWHGALGVLRAGVPYFTAGVSATVLALADQIAASTWLQDADRGNYAIALRMAGLVALTSHAVGIVAFVDGSREAERRDEAFYLRHRVLIGVMVVGILALVPISWFGIPIVFGPEFEVAKRATLMLLPGALLQALSHILEKRAEGEGRPRVATLSRVAALVSFGALAFLPTISIEILAVIFSVAHMLRYVLLVAAELKTGEGTLADLLWLRRTDIQLVLATLKGRSRRTD